MQDFWSLRTRILRPAGAPLCVFPGDLEADTAHFAAYDEAEGGRIVGVATVRPASTPPDLLGAAVEAAQTASKAGVPDSSSPTPTAWQLRGMATETGRQKGGVGRAVLNAVAAHVRAQGGPAGALLWANARVVALDFYKRNGWKIYGDEFIVPDVGPHFLMARTFKPEEEEEEEGATNATTVASSQELEQAAATTPMADP
jgi:GNAT superfamily N-acetyltransferase